MFSGERPMRIAFDITLMRPGSPMLQAAYRCDVGLADLFPEEMWLTGPTHDLRIYDLDRSRVPLLVERAKEFHAKEKL